MTLTPHRSTESEISLVCHRTKKHLPQNHIQKYLSVVRCAHPSGLHGLGESMRTRKFGFASWEPQQVFADVYGRPRGVERSEWAQAVTSRWESFLTCFFSGRRGRWTCPSGVAWVASGPQLCWRLVWRVVAGEAGTPHLLLPLEEALVVVLRQAQPQWTQRRRRRPIPITRLLP